MILTMMILASVPFVKNVNAAVPDNPTDCGKISGAQWVPTSPPDYAAPHCYLGSGVSDADFVKYMCSGSNQYVIKDADGTRSCGTCSYQVNATADGCVDPPQPGQSSGTNNSSGTGNSSFDGTPTFFNWGGGGITGLLATILNWMAIGVAIAVVGGIIYGAIMYTTSGGNQEQTKKSMGIIRNAIIALILYFAMWALLNWLIPGGLFSS